MARRKRVSEEGLKAIIADGIRTSAGYQGGELQRRREKALEYYLGYPNGKEVEGRSSVLSTDVMDTVESMLPGLLKPFTAAGEVVRFDPVGPEDEAQADQATEYVNHVFLKKNNGFQLLHEGFKDALLSGIGVFYYYWDEREDVTRETYEGLPTEELVLLLADDNIEPVEHTERDDGLHDVTIARTSQVGSVKIDTIAPEDFLIERKARFLEEANFVAHRVKTTASDLLAMGFSKAKVDSIQSHDEEDLSTERLLREGLDDSDFGNNSTGEDAFDDSRRQIWLYNCFVKTDRNGDGIAEIVNVLAAGSGSYEILDEQEVDDFPYACLIPIPMPHRFFGMSLADQLFEVQDIKTALWRSLLDNVYLSNNARHEVVEGQVNMNDMINSRPGGVVRVKAPGMINQLQSMPVAGQALSALEYADTVKENRTGVTKYNQGLDANSLNQTATGVNLIMGMAQQRIEMIARLFAEGGIRDLFVGILKLVVQHQTRPEMVRLYNEWVPMDPRNWKTEYDITVNVGLGSGSQEQQVMVMNKILEIQREIASNMGMGQGSLVTRKNIYNSLKKMAEAAGLKDPASYFTPPAPDGSDEPQPQPDPNVVFMQTQLEIEREKLSVKMQEMQTKHAHDMHELNARMDLEREKMEMQMALEREKLAVSMEETAAKIAADAEAGSTKLQVQAALEREKAELAAVSQELDRAERQADKDPVVVNVGGGDRTVRVSRDANGDLVGTASNA